LTRNSDQERRFAFQFRPGHEDFSTLFTAKKRRGIGLGLPICQRIVKNHGGRVEVKSQQEIGTTFIIYLPRESTPIAEETPKNVPNG
jgi:K+-sensing histidine kinase KdpD